MANLLLNADLWEDGDSNSPPAVWNTTQYEDLWTEGAFRGISINKIVAGGTADDVIAGTFTPSGNALPIYFSVSDYDTGEDLFAQYEIEANESVVFSVANVPGMKILISSNSYYDGSYVLVPAPNVTPVAASYNCGCDCGYPTKTLDQLINDVAIGMGYSAQLAVLPASFRASVIFNLNMMQALVVSDLSEISNDRYFTWSVAAGETKFCPTENLETCRNLLLATRISEVYTVRDSGNIIERLAKGIPFKLHQAGDPQSFPSRYEVRSCIEIWPPPSEAMTLVAKGTLAAVDMVVGTDKCMVDPRALVMRTLAFMKGAKGHPDAGNWMGQYQSYIGDLCGSSHMDERYVPPSRRYEDWELEILTHVMQRRIYSDGSGS